jgi:uncharacterized protein (DUF2235 family)
MTRRNLIICFDGTWNDAKNMDGGAYAPTNVKKFYDAVASEVSDPPTIQERYYEDGVGTRPMEAIPGGIYGYGLPKRVQGAYRWLSEQFNSRQFPRPENRVIVIGFSRGAYTARRLAGLIDFCGLSLDPNDDDDAWEIYSRQDENGARHMLGSGRCQNIPIEMVGVFDTVKSTLDADFNDSQLSSNVVAGFHAMSIDEKRRDFPVLRWDEDPRVLQKWFAGVHCDVGGGYKQKTLSDVVLMWMINRAYEHGVQFDGDYIANNIKPNPKGKKHESFTGIWLARGAKQRKIDPTDFLDDSVRIRLTTSKYDPTNIPKKPRFTED